MCKTLLGRVAQYVPRCPLADGMGLASNAVVKKWLPLRLGHVFPRVTTPGLGHTAATPTRSLAVGMGMPQTAPHNWPEAMVSVMPLGAPPIGSPSYQ